MYSMILFLKIKIHTHTNVLSYLYMHRKDWKGITQTIRSDVNSGG